MTEPKRTDEPNEGLASVTDPVAAADRGGLSIDRQRIVHESREQYRDHCESDAVGRAIVGVTNADDRLLLVVDREREVAVLPNDTVAPDEDWAIVAREWVEGAAGIDVTIEGIERIRRVDHAIEGEDSSVSTAHHVVFSGTTTETAIDGLCADNPFELGWYDELPVASEGSRDHIADINVFID